MPRIEPGAIARTTPAPIPITRVVSPPGQEEEDHSIVEVDPGENPNVKSEGWMSTGGDGEIADYEIPSEQFEQDMQAEDEQYIQAGNDALSGQQVELFSYFADLPRLLFEQDRKYFLLTFQNKRLSVCKYKLNAKNGIDSFVGNSALIFRIVFMAILI